MAIDQVRLDEFLGRAVNDLGAAMSGLLVVVGDRLGLYKAMAGAGPMKPAALALRATCRTTPRNTSDVRLTVPGNRM